MLALFLSIPAIEMNAGTLSSNFWYPITVFFCESHGNDFIQIERKKDSSHYSTSWTGRLRNLLPGIIIYEKSSCYEIHRQTL